MRHSSSSCQMELGNRCEAMAAALTSLPGLTPTNRPNSRPQRKTLQLEKSRNNKNNSYARISVICAVVVFAFAMQHFQSPIRTVEAADAAVKTTSQQQGPANQTSTATTNRQTASGKDTAPTSQQPEPAKDQKATKKSSSASLEPEATDLSSMYVQIPIAEPVGEAGSAGDQQSQQEVSQEADSGADTNKATTWTGPWPKKFQIGYIKQSDLHQVLIESLKNDPFIGTTKSTPATSVTQSKTSATKSAATQAPVASKSAPASDAASLMAVGYPQLKAAQQTIGGNHEHSQQRPAIGAQQYQQQQQQQFWPPTVQTYGRLAMPHVMMPRPKGNLYVPGSFMHQQQHPQHHLRNSRHQLNLGGQNHHGHMQQPAGLGMPNGFRQNVHFNHPGRQQNGHNMQLFVQQQQQPKAGIMSNFAQQPAPQYQFAGLPSGSMRNQPIYTMNSFPAPQQQHQPTGIDADPMQLIQMAGLGAGQQQVGYGPAAGHLNTMNRGQPPKTSDYIASSWRPVTSQDDERQAQQNANDASMNDGFDDGFSMPNGASGSKDSPSGQNSSSNSDSMNRHPALNNYLGQQQNSSAKVSPANMLKSRDQQPVVKSKPSAGSTKGAREEDIQQQQQKSMDDGSIKTAMGRRALPNNSTLGGGQTNATMTTTTPTSLIGENGTTPIAQENVDSTTAASVTTTTVGSLDGSTVSGSSNSSDTSGNTTTSSSQDETTTEPDSEVIEGEATTEPSDQEVATTTASSIESMGRTSSTVATPNSTSNSDSEAVATQTPGSAATFPAVQSEEASTTSGTDSTTTTTTNNSNREETTPNSLSAPSSSTASASQASSTTDGGDVAVKGGEIEGAGNSTMQSASLRNGRTDATISDEQLLASARASDLTKSKTGKTSTKGRSSLASQQQASPSVTAKKARSSNSQSSERLVQASQARQQPVEPSSSSATASSAAGRKSQATKLITRRPDASRASKQLAGGTKSSTASGSLKQKSATTSANQKKQTKPNSGAKSSQSKARKSSSQKITRMVQSERLQAAQVVSMTPAQAQSTAQTLASLLLSRCLSSSNCAHLLDVCSTKQAAVPINLQSGETNTSNGVVATSANNSAAWSMPIGLMSSQLMSLMEALQADRALKLLPAWRDAIENIVDQDTQTGYTLLMPSNDAIERMSAGQLDALLASGEQMSQLIDNHILDSAETIEIGGGANRTVSRYLRSKRLQVNQHRDRQLTLNGKRIVYANQLAPGGGRIHVIDGLLDWPSGSAPSSRLLDIMDTLKQCDKFDGFVTLAEGTGLAQILKQDEPLTVFVPSNEALRKIPDEELEVIKNNSTALREFIMYHIVNGSYFSQDLRDGQQLTSILDMKPIQVGVRVDGCSRRLVEANTSPMRRPDIVAKNGVIHILDWYLTTRDNEWCDQVGRSQGSLTSSSSSSSSSATPRDSSERLQQLASEPMVIVSSSSSVSSSGPSAGSPITTNDQHSMSPTGYATRMNALPANHKQEQSATDELQAQASGIKPTVTTKTGERVEQAHSVYVSALPVSELHQVP